MSLESSTQSDTHAAVQNLRSIAALANDRGDRAIHLTAALMEALAHLRSANYDSIEQVQRALASAWTYQLDADTEIPQLKCLAHILDLTCSFLQGSPAQTLNKLRQMQIFMDGTFQDPSWTMSNDTILIPINRLQGQAQLVSHDTSGVLGIDKYGHDVLKISFLTKEEAYGITLAHL